jgi:hypothetical protein
LGAYRVRLRLAGQFFQQWRWSRADLAQGLQCRQRRRRERASSPTATESGNESRLERGELERTGNL